MNRKVMFGIAVFVAVIGIGLLGGEKEAAAGRGCRGCGGGLFAGRCGGKEACHSDSGCHRERCGGRNRCGGLFGGRKDRCAGRCGGRRARCGGQAACCAPAPACCEPAPACCEPAPACCEPAPCATECAPCATGCPTGACGGAAAGEVITEQPAEDKVPDAPKEGGAA